MPSVEHNSKFILEIIESETKIVKDFLHRLRFIIEKGQADTPPIKVMNELSLHSLILARAIQQYTIRHDYVDQNENVLFSNYETPFELLNSLLKEDPEIFTRENKDEFKLYEEFGFSRKEYDDIKLLTSTIAKNPEDLDFVKAFDTFVSEILEKYKKTSSDVFFSTISKILLQHLLVSLVLQLIY